MCVAIAIPRDGETPTIDELAEMEESNPDGAGIAWAADGEVQWLKGLKAREVDVLLNDLPVGPKLLHFRLATAGGDSAELTHPFPVEKAPRVSLSGRAREVLIHNGHISDWELYAALQGPLPTGPWSDTRLVARLAAIRSHSILKHSGLRGQKFATLNREGSITLFGDWVNRNGTHYSNMYWVGGMNWRRQYSIPYSSPRYTAGDFDTPPATYGTKATPVKASETYVGSGRARRKARRTGHYDRMKGWSYVADDDK